ncbi:uncharacterized protein LOC129702569 isoform X1 [Leucoraja erinacea]|uniref:uncharacterized protein LOC129702569 isoform X1 n=1 Tax=Leucoraja erinaceus TaxID=7782 RepID=UPI002453F607|nr:uncharacterized protein LOC129702569 isoform X1 [Leucoraja erinacea]
MLQGRQLFPVPRWAVWGEGALATVQRPGRDAMDAQNGCHVGVWGLLAVTALALLASLVMNVIYCTATRQRAPRPIYRSVSQLQSPTIQEVDDHPIYGNLIPDNIVESENCYEAMTPGNRSGNETKVAIENQMCYASLDLSVQQKKRRRKIEKQKTNNDMSDAGDDNSPFNPHTLTSQPTIYLNNEQINFNEGLREETIHSDPTIFYGKINTSHSKLSVTASATAIDF